MAYKIEKALPVPENPSAAYFNKYGYPFASMEVGDSFFEDRKEREKYLRAKCAVYKRKYGKHFVSRKVEGGLRIWRVA